jgi:hypothetical protein
MVELTQNLKHLKSTWSNDSLKWNYVFFDEKTQTLQSGQSAYDPELGNLTRINTAPAKLVTKDLKQVLPG